MKKIYNLKKVKNVLLLILMFFCLSFSVAFNCSAETIKEIVVDDIFTYEVEISYSGSFPGDDITQTIRLIDVDDSADGEIVVSEDVKIIDDDAFNGCKNITKVIIPETVESIGGYAFANCESLTSIEVPNSVTNLGSCAFKNCKNLKDVKLSNSIVVLSPYLFEDCASLKSLAIPDSVEKVCNGVFIGCDSLEEIKLNENSSFCVDESGAFYDKDKTVIISFLAANGVTSYSVPETVKRVSNYAFYNCRNLIDIHIPDSVENIGVHAFEGTGYYNDDANWESGVLYIDNFLIKAKENLTGKYIIKDGTILLADEAFYKSTISEITMPETLVGISKNAFYNCENLKTINFSQSVQFIGEDAFRLCASLKKIAVPDTVLILEHGAFSSCENVEEIKIGKNIKEISDHCFFSLKKVKELKIPDSVERIGKYAFSYCENLEKVQFSEGLKVIDDEAFLGTDKLTEFYLPDSVEIIGRRALNNRGLQKIRIGAQVKSIGKYAFSSDEIYCALTWEEWNVATSYSNYFGVKYMTHPSMEHSYTKIIEVQPAGEYRYGKITVECEYGCGKTVVKNGDPPLRSVGAVTDLTGTIQGCTVLLNWNEATNATHYIIYKYDNGDWKEIGFTTNTEYSVSSDVHPEAYAVRASAVDVDETGEHELYSKDFALYFKEHGVYSDVYAVRHVNSMMKDDSVKETHSNTVITTKATLETDGKISNKCTVCGYIASKVTVINKPASFTLSTTEYTYNKTERKPKVTVKDSAGNKLVEGADYRVGYEDGRVLPGKYTVKITFKGKYEGVKRLYFTIKPRVTTEISATQTITTLTLNWKKVTGADGYRVYKYNSATGDYDYFKTSTSTTLKLKDLTGGTIFKFKVRAYKEDEGKIYGSYSPEFETATKTTTPKITDIYSKTTGKAVVKWSEVDGETGFQLYYATSKDGEFKKVKSYVADKLAGSKTGLTSGKTYYFKVRAYKKTSSGTVYSSWSSVKSVKVK